MSDYKAILYTLENDVAWVTLNRPEQRNAVNAEMREELIAVFTAARSDPHVRALVLTGSGKGFAPARISPVGAGRDPPDPGPGVSSCAPARSA